MAWFAIVVFAVVLILALAAVVLLAGYISREMDDKRARIQWDVRSAERRLHDIARDGFVAMLDEARARAGR